MPGGVDSYVKFFIHVNTLSYPADKVLYRKRAGNEPASGAEEHSSVMFNSCPVTINATTHINEFPYPKKGRLS
jgi:hypothetical protein